MTAEVSAAQSESRDYTFDPKTHLITMADGFTFNPFNPEETKTLTPAQTRAALIEHGQIGGGTPSLEEKVIALAALVTGEEAKAADLKAEAAKHTASADSYKAELRQLLDLGTHTFGNIKVTISKPSRSFDADAFMKAYPVEINPALYKAVIDSAAMPPKLKDQFMVAGTGDPKVAVK